jgi:cell division protein FtsN
MVRWAYSYGVLLYCAANLAVAQAPARTTDPVFVRAQGLVSDGNGVAGRALIDSVIKATSPTARLYPEALFWRASLASNAADAESDYKHIVVDYPLAPQAEDALLRLAQLELARGDREGALIHLQRIPRDYPRSKSLARASYWTARVLFEKNDVPNACAANANALAQVGDAEIELRNQIQYQGQRCASIAAAVTPPTNTAASTPSNPAPAESQAPTPKTTVADTISATVPAPAPPPVKATIQDQRPKPPTQANDTKPSIVDPTKSPANEVVKPPVKPTTTTSRPITYSVQVAAYNRRAEADRLTASLTKRGYQARVDGDVAPFRVRIGRYATNKDAEDALKRIKAKQMDGFVVRAPER